jgi:hypothetical protein
MPVIPLYFKRCKRGPTWYEKLEETSESLIFLVINLAYKVPGQDIVYAKIVSNS